MENRWAVLTVSFLLAALPGRSLLAVQSQDL